MHLCCTPSVSQYHRKYLPMNSLNDLSQLLADKFIFVRVLHSTFYVFNTNIELKLKLKRVTTPPIFVVELYIYRPDTRRANELAD